MLLGKNVSIWWRMRNWLNLYFNLSKREFNGLLALVGLIVLVTALGSIFQSDPGRSGDRRTEQLAIQKLMSENPYAHGAESSKIKRAYDKPEAALFAFDPNVIGIGDWQKLGLSEKQSAAILRYRAKGGRFRKKEDLGRMYTISEKMYRRLAPYVRIAAETDAEIALEKKDYTDRPRAEKPVLKIIEINTADSVLLCEVRGIGPAFARRIVKYRERIGGFYDKSQLMEVFGLDSAKYQEIKDQLSIEAGRIRKININTAQFEELKNHPYLRYKQINALLAYRKQHGNYSNIADLSKVLILDPDNLARIAPYLTF